MPPSTSSVTKSATCASLAGGARRIRLRADDRTARPASHLLGRHPPRATAAPTVAVYAAARRRRSSCACSTTTTASGESERRVRLTGRRPRHWHRLRARTSARPALRLPGRRSRGSPRRGLRHNPAKLLLDPYARAIEGAVDLAPGGLRPHRRTGPARRHRLSDDRDSAAYVPRGVVVPTTASTGADDARPQVALARHRHLRGARQRPDQLDPASARRSSAAPTPGVGHPATIEHLTGLGVTAVELLPVHALRQRAALARRGRLELLGLQHAGLLRAARRRTPRRRPAAAVARVQGHGRGAARGRARGDPRRRLQPHLREGGRRRRRCRCAGWTTAPTTGSTAQGRRRRRDRAAATPSTCGTRSAAAGPRLAALLGRRTCTSTASGSTWRPRWPAAATTPTTRDHPFLMALRTDPVLSRRQADRRAVGRRPARLAHRAVPAAVRASGTTASATPCATSGWRTAAPAHGQTGHGVRELASRLSGSQDLFGSRRPAARSRRSTSSPPTTASPCATCVLRPQAQRGQRRATTATAPTTTGPGTTASRARPTIPTILAPRAAAGPQPARHPAALDRRADAAPRATRWAAPSRATTTPTARTTRSPGSTGTSSRWQQDLLATTRQLLVAAPRPPALRHRQFFDGQPRPIDGTPDLVWYAADGEPDDRRRPGTTRTVRDVAAGGCPRRHRRSSDRCRRPAGGAARRSGAIDVTLPGSDRRGGRPTACSGTAPHRAAPNADPPQQLSPCRGRVGCRSAADEASGRTRGWSAA